MDSVEMFKSYPRVEDELEEQAFRRESRKRLIIITLSSILFVTIIVGAVIGTVGPSRNTSTKDRPPSLQPPTNITSESVCEVTQYPHSCIASLNSSSSSNPQQLFIMSLQVALDELLNLSSIISSKSNNDPLVQHALRNCEYLISDAVVYVNMSIEYLKEDKQYLVMKDVRRWLSTAMTDEETCLAGVVESSANTEMRIAMRNSTEFTSNSLAIIGILIPPPMHRKLLKAAPSDRRLLQQAKNLKPNLTVGTLPPSIKR